MKKMASFGMGMLSAGVVGLSMYAFMNKKTKSKADDLLNNVLDKVNNSNMMKNTK